jgi:hypothetical protein
LTVQRSAPIEVSPERRIAMVRDIMTAGLVRAEDFGAYAEKAAAYQAIMCLSHGLDPFNKEVTVWPVTRNKKTGKKDSSGKDIWESECVGFNVSVSPKAYLRKANEAAGPGNHYVLGKAITLEVTDVLARHANVCSMCNGAKVLGKGPNTYTCKKCGGKGVFDAKEVIVVLQPILLESEAVVAIKLGMKPEPRYGEGVWQPGDGNPNGRSPWWLAWKRAWKDAFGQAYSLDFSLPWDKETMGERAPEVLVIDPSESGASVIVNGEAKEIVPDAEPEGVFAGADVVELAGITAYNGDELDAMIERMILAGYDDRANVVNSMVTLGMTEYTESNREKIETELLEFLKEEEVNADMDEGFSAAVDGKAKHEAQVALESLGYKEGKPQAQLLKSLFGEGVTWVNINAGQLKNMVCYATMAHLAKTTKEVPALLAVPELGLAATDENAYDVETYLDVLKERTRIFTKRGKFIAV